MVAVRTRLRLAFLVLLMFPVALSAQTVQIGSLDDALKLGRERNLALQESAKGVEVAQAGVTRTQALFLPHLSFDFALSRKDAVFEMPAGMSLAGKKDPGFFFGYEKEWFGRLNLNQPLFVLGNFGRRNVSRLGLASSESSRDMQRLEVELEVTRSYYTVLLMQQVVEIKENLIEQSKRHQAEVGRRLEAGDVARFDKLRADVQLANLYPELIRSKNSVEVALAQLKNVLGIRQEEQVQVSGALEYTPEEFRLPELLKEALEQRPEVDLSRLQREIAERNLSITRSQWLPTVGAFFTEDLRSPEAGKLFNGKQTNWTFGLSVNFSIFDGGDTLFKSREDRRRIEEAQVAEERIKRDIEVQVIRAALELQRATEVIESQKQNVRQAEEAMQIADSSYSGGLITNLELMDTQLALDQARTNYITAVYDYLIGLAEYRRAVGRSR